MYILIIGGGKIGYYLTKTLLQANYSVGIVEQDEKRCVTLAEDFEITVINGDGTDIKVLREAAVADARYAVAVTGRDEVNLVICQLAKKYFQVPVTIARVNNPENQRIFKILGVDATISTTALAAQFIGNELPLNGMRILSLFQQGDVEVVEVELKESSPVTGSAVSRLELPDECVLITVIHDGKISFPRGKTILRANDRIFALVKRESVDFLKKNLLGGSK